MVNWIKWAKLEPSPIKQCLDLVLTKRQDDLNHRSKLQERNRPCFFPEPDFQAPEEEAPRIQFRLRHDQIDTRKPLYRSSYPSLISIDGGQHNFRELTVTNAGINPLLFLFDSPLLFYFFLFSGRQAMSSSSFPKMSALLRIPTN